MTDASNTHSSIEDACCPDDSKTGVDVVFWSFAGLVAALYALGLAGGPGPVWLGALSHAVLTLMNTVWWGVLIGVVMVGLLAKVPRDMVIAILGRDGGFGGILRATFAGLLLDLCSHGILMVGVKLYERGATAGQMIAFLLASPWNSFSLTLILIALVGLTWTLVFIGLSFVVAITAGLAFDACVARGVLAPNPNRRTVPKEYDLKAEIRSGLASVRFNRSFWTDLLQHGMKDGRIVVKWLLVGVVLASLIQTFVETSSLQAWFGPTLAGLAFTLIAATIIEVCSEGSTPIAADLLTRAGAPGNSFAFLMTGVATDYTEVMVLRESTKSWRFALFLPLLSVPQIVALSWMLNSL